MRLRAIEKEAGSSARYWSARGGIARDVGALDEAANCYDQALSREPERAVARHGRARIALERGEPDASARFDDAIRFRTGEAELWLGKAQALEARGKPTEARHLAEHLVEQAPQWIDALELLSQLRWAAGERQCFCDHYAKSHGLFPTDSNLVLSWVRMLAGVDDHRAAALVAQAALRKVSENRGLALAEAVHASAAGEQTWAERFFASHSPRDDGERVQWARHHLRWGEVEKAEKLLCQVIRATPDHVAAWALLDVAWRTMGDARSDWLHGQAGLVSTLPLPIPADELLAALSVLHRLHDAAGQPVGQSVRDGTQTRGALFDRMEAEVRRLRDALVIAVEAYRNGLPPMDPTHPLLRYRTVTWRLSHSWSVRLSAGGRHAEHIHPQGLISSATYLQLPPEDPANPDAAMLELGRPPADLRSQLGPIMAIRPQVGHLALFPSTLFHGTTQFPAGRRVTVAFDVTRVP